MDNRRHPIAAASTHLAVFTWLDRPDLRASVVIAGREMAILPFPEPE